MAVPTSKVRVYNAPPARVLSALAAYVIACGALYLISFSWYQSEAVRNAQVEATLLQGELLASLERVQHLPAMLAEDPVVRSGLGQAAATELNSRLAEVAKTAGVEAIYAIDRRARVVAVSNRDSPDRFLGQDFGYMAHMRQVLSGGVVEFFATGVAGRQAEYFIAVPVYPNDQNVRPVGAIALKVDLNGASAGWGGPFTSVMVTNRDGIVTLATDETWLYRTAEDISPTRLAGLRGERQFGDEPLSPLDINRDSTDTLRLDGRTYVAAAVAVGRLGWQLNYLTDTSVIRAKAAQTILSASLMLLMLGAGLAAIRSLRMK